MAKIFDRALSFVLGNEGELSDHPADRGGATNLGITAGTLARARMAGIVGTADVRALTRDEAAKIYKVLYWRAAHCDVMDAPLCVMHFDAAVNHGIGGAWTIPLSVDKERKRHVIWAAGDAELAAIKANYTQAEIESWSKQEQGAKDINAGSTATDAAQFVASIATARGISLETLVTKILANVSSYGALAAAVIGQQQRLDTLITASTTQAELDAIVWTSISGGTA